MTNPHDADNLPGPVARVSEEWRPDYDPHAWVGETQPPPTGTPTPVSAADTLADMLAELVGDPNDTTTGGHIDPIAAMFTPDDEPTHDTTPHSYTDTLTPDELGEFIDDLAQPWDDPEAERNYNDWMATLAAEGVDTIPDRSPPVEPSAAERIPLGGGAMRERMIRGSAIFDLPQPTWLVDGLVQEQSITQIIGAPGCGKTFLALDLALCTLTQQPWQGHTTNADPLRPVLWMAGEGLHEIGRRIKAWCAHHGVDPGSIIDRFIVVPGGGDLSDPRMADELRHLAGSIDCQPQLCIVDTQARHYVGSDEQSSQALGVFFHHMQDVADLDMSVVIVHHAGKDTAKGGRGSNVQDGHVRSIIAMSKSDKPGTATIKHTKANNGAELPLWVTELVPAGVDPTTGGHLSVVAVIRGADPYDDGALGVLLAYLGSDHTGLGVSRAQILPHMKDNGGHTQYRVTGLLEWAQRNGMVVRGTGHLGRYRLATGHDDIAEQYWLTD